MFWERRIRYSYVWSLFLSISNFMLQIIAIVNPRSEEQRQVNMVYSIGSVFIFVLMYLHYKKKCNAQYWVLVYLFIRNGIRFLDFENTKAVINT